LAGSLDCKSSFSDMGVRIPPAPQYGSKNIKNEL